VNCLVLLTLPHIEAEGGKITKANARLLPLEGMLSALGQAITSSKGMGNPPILGKVGGQFF